VRWVLHFETFSYLEKKKVLSERAYMQGKQCRWLLKYPLIVSGGDLKTWLPHDSIRTTYMRVVLQYKAVKWLYMYVIVQKKKKKLNI
jgi:hypothetical protein